MTTLHALTLAALALTGVGALAIIVPGLATALRIVFPGLGVAVDALFARERT